MSYQVLDVGIASSNTISEDMLDVEPNWNNCIKFLQEIIPLLIEITIWNSVLQDQQNFKGNTLQISPVGLLCRKNNMMPI